MTTTISDPTSPATPSAISAKPACGPPAVGGLLLGWTGLAALLAAGLAGALFASLPPAINHVFSLILLASLLLPPAGAALILARRPGWAGLKPLALALLLAVGYALLAVAVRAVAGEDQGLEATLRLVGLAPAGLLAGAITLRRSGIPARSLVRGLGLHGPALAGLMGGGAAIGLLTIGWPLTGALGDSWASLGLLWQGLGATLPEEVLFRGLVLGLFIHYQPGRNLRAGFLSLLVYLAFIPTRILPGGEWGVLGLIPALAPMALLVIALRVVTGSIWAGVLVAWLYRALPRLFTDPRDEILDPAQWVAGGWMVLGALGLALLLWIGRRTLAPRWRLSGIGTVGVATLLAVVIWGGWFSAWALAGEPGFHNDGFIIMMSEQADLGAAYSIDDPVARRAYVYETLVRTAEETQAPLRARLEERGFAYRPYYLINMIKVEGHHRERGRIAQLPGVAYVMLNPNVRPYPSYTALGTTPAPESQGVEWNLQRLGAEAVWEMGYRGQGVVVGGQDTGYDWDHPALRDSYRGWNAAGGQAGHDYNWHDSWDDTTAPHDDGTHGTHTMGIIVGDDGGDNHIGLAPEAQWMGCRNMRRGLGNPASYTECMEFFLAPYPIGGDPFHDGDVTRSPDVINNSWGCPDIEGCQADTLEPAVEALRAAGIMMVVSAGNDGPACRTATVPPARYDAVFSVGATDSSGQVTFFSSRGPIAGVGQGGSLLKPDIAAPGSDIRSSLAGGGYGSASGTSMAGPHVTGLVALLWSARPELRGQIEATEDIIRQSATPVAVPTACPVAAQTPSEPGLLAQVFSALDSAACACGGVTGVPNNVYGWGEIDALRAVELALEH